MNTHHGLHYGLNAAFASQRLSLQRGMDVAVKKIDWVLMSKYFECTEADP